MKKTLLIFACAFTSLVVSCSTAQTPGKQPSPAPSVSAEKTSMDYFNESMAALETGDNRKAVEFDQKAFDLELKERKLPRDLWLQMINTLAAAYALNGEVKRGHEIIDYGIKHEPQYPMFYYIKAIAFAQEDKEDDAIKWLRPAFKYKANRLEGENFPNPETDSSFEKFRNSEKFKKAIAEMKSGK